MTYLDQVIWVRYEASIGLLHCCVIWLILLHYSLGDIVIKKCKYTKQIKNDMRIKGTNINPYYLFEKTAGIKM